MKIGILILNSMFLLLFISVIIGEWGDAPAIVAGIGVVNLVINSLFIFFRTINDLKNI